MKESEPSKNRNLLIVILAISFAGMLFSGVLAYTELAGRGISCTAMNKILVIPPCVYGLIMYSLIFILAILLLIKSKRGNLNGKA